MHKKAQAMNIDPRKYPIVSCVVCLFLLYESLYFYRTSDPTNLPGENFSGSPELSNVNAVKVDTNSPALSILGEWLRAPEETPPPKPTNRNTSHLLILVWKYGPFLERRHIRRFAANSSSSSPWQDCSVKNCRLSYRDDDLPEADAVLFHLHLSRSAREMPAKRGKPGQIWIFMTDESPLHTFLYRRNDDGGISDYDDLFDWSMTYRSDSDVPVAYGRTVRRARRKKRDTNRVKKSKLVAIMGSNCSGENGRWKYARELKRLLGGRLDVYGRCLGGNATACPGHFERDCPMLGAYKFYLAFENSDCREYLTEKVYWNAYEKRSVPVVMGAPREDCRRLLPPHSFLHVDDFSTPSELANYLDYLDANDAAYERFHRWRSRYVVLNEHGYFGSASKYYCRVCEALSYNPTPVHKYRSIASFWNASRDCSRRPHV